MPFRIINMFNLKYVIDWFSGFALRARLSNNYEVNITALLLKCNRCKRFLCFTLFSMNKKLRFKNAKKQRTERAIFLQLRKNKECEIMNGLIMRGHRLKEQLKLNGFGGREHQPMYQSYLFCTNCVLYHRGRKFQ